MHETTAPPQCKYTCSFKNLYPHNAGPPLNAANYHWLKSNQQIAYLTIVNFLPIQSQTAGFNSTVAKLILRLPYAFRAP